MTRTREGEPAGPALLAFAGVAAVLALIARALLGPSSPLRGQLAATGGALAGYGALYALILSVVLPLAVTLGVAAWVVWVA